MTDLRETLSVIADWCDCDHPAYGIEANRHLPSCRYGIVEDAVDGTGLTIARTADPGGHYERMVAEFVGVEVLLSEALQRTKNALALTPEATAPEWTAHGLAAVEHLDDLWRAGEPGGIGSADWNAAIDAIRAAFRNGTPEATAPRAMTIGEWEALPYTKVEPDEGYG